jgi:hypothetical protein
LALNFDRWRCASRLRRHRCYVGATSWPISRPCHNRGSRTTRRLQKRWRKRVVPIARGERSPGEHSDTRDLALKRWRRVSLRSPGLLAADLLPRRAARLRRAGRAATSFQRHGDADRRQPDRRRRDDRSRHRDDLDRKTGPARAEAVLEGNVGVLPPVRPRR